MVTVLGHRGMLGSVVERRWKELGDSDHVIVCLRPDDLPLIRRLAFRPGVIVPSTDAILEDSPYAKGKREIEAIPGLVVIRSGLVDVTRVPAEAYDDWLLNPLTPLEWADLAWERKDHPGVHVEGRESVSRYEVSRMVREVFGRSTRITRRTSGEPLNRVQSQTRDWPPLREALEAYRAWLSRKNGGTIERSRHYWVGERGPERIGW